MQINNAKRHVPGLIDFIQNSEKNCIFLNIFYISMWATHDMKIFTKWVPIKPQNRDIRFEFYILI